MPACPASLFIACEMDSRLRGNDGQERQALIVILGQILEVIVLKNINCILLLSSEGRLPENMLTLIRDNDTF